MHPPPKPPLFPLKASVLNSVTRFLASTPSYPLLPIQDIFKAISTDINQRRKVAISRGQLGNVFYELVDAGKIPELKDIRLRDRATRGRGRGKLRKERRERRRRKGGKRRVAAVEVERVAIPPKPPITHTYTPSSSHRKQHSRTPYQKQSTSDLHAPIQSTPPLTLPSSRPPSTASSSSTRILSSIPYASQRTLLESMHRLCLYSCFTFCKTVLKHDITRNIDDPIRSFLDLPTLIAAIISSWNSGRLDPALISEDAGFGSGNAFERAGCVVDAMVWKNEMGDRRLLSVLQAGEELVGALLDEERLERADGIYKRAERMIKEGRGEGVEEEREGEDTEMEDEDA